MNTNKAIEILRELVPIDKNCKEFTALKRIEVELREQAEARESDLEIISKLENRLDAAISLEPRTLYDELKADIVTRLYQLELHDLQNIEVMYL